MPACSSMTAKAAGRGLSPSLATVAYFAPTARFRVRRSRPTTAVARLGLRRLETRDRSPAPGRRPAKALGVVDCAQDSLAYLVKSLANHPGRLLRRATLSNF